MRLTLSSFRFFAKNSIVVSLILMASMTGGFLAACGEVEEEIGTEETEETEESMDHDDMDHGEMDHEEMDHDMAMDLGPADEKYDLRFIDAMIPHHEGAIMMAEDALEKSERSEMQELAEEIIAAQEEEIAQLREWRSEWYPDVDDTPMAYDPELEESVPMTEEQEAAMMMSMDLGEADDEFDLRFIEAMIPHHEGAVMMAQDALEKSERSEIQELSEEIIAAQEAEIEKMREWQEQWQDNSY